MEKPTIPETLERETGEKVEEVKQRAMTLDEAKTMTDFFDKWYYSNDRSHDAELEVIQDAVMNSSVTVQTLVEYRMVLEKALGQDKAEKILAHENAHANVALSLGAEFMGYTLLICKDKDDFAIRGGASYRLPIEWTDEEKKAAHIRIYAAPEEYGEKLSHTDEKVIDGLKD